MENGNGKRKLDAEEPTPKKRKVRIAEDQNVTHLLEQAEHEHGDKKVLELSPKGVKQASVALVKVVERNELQRAQYAEEPDQYMESELQLYDQIESLKTIAADPSLYETILETDIMSILTKLTLHENSDIAEAVLGVWLEWFDSSLLAEESSAGPVIALTVELVKDSLDSIVANLARLSQETDDNVGQGVDNVLLLIENLLEIDFYEDQESLRKLLPDTIAYSLCKHTTLCSWLIEQVAKDTVEKDKSLEILALLTPREEIYEAISDWKQLPPYTSVLSEDDKKTSPVDAIETLLQQVGVFRKAQPEDDTQVDALENAAIAMSSILTYAPLNINAFLEAQGVELIIKCLKERVHAGGVTLKWLDTVGSLDVHRKLCEHAVQAGVLKYLFPILMGKHTPKGALVTSKKAKKEWNESVLETAIRVLYNLTTHLDDDSPNDTKQRLITKFLDEEKCKRLASLLVEYDKKARLAEYEFYRSDVEESMGDDEEAVQLAALDAKLSGGGDIFHRLGSIASFCCIGSKRCSEVMAAALKEQESGVGLIHTAVEEFVSVLDDSPTRKKLQEYLTKLE